MSEGYVRLKSLVTTGNYRPEPPNCKRNLGDSKCLGKLKGGKCPTNALETGECGGWKPRDNGLIPLLQSLIEKVKGS